MPFKKGQSGNPGGLTKAQRDLQTKIAKLAAEKAPRAVERLAEFVEHEEPYIALQAITGLLDRAVGKPRQQTELETGENGFQITVVTGVPQADGRD